MDEALEQFLERDSRTLDQMEELVDYSAFIHYDESQIGETRVRSSKQSELEEEPPQRHARPEKEVPRPSRQEKRRQMEKEELAQLRLEYERQEKAAREQYIREREADIVQQIQAGPMPAVMAASVPTEKKEPASELTTPKQPVVKQKEPKQESKPKSSKSASKSKKKKKVTNSSQMLTMVVAAVALIALFICLLIAMGKVPGLGNNSGETMLLAWNEMRCVLWNVMNT